MNISYYDALAISGQSGIGKTYLAKYLQNNYPFELVVSTTTRPIRVHDGEIDGVDYNFVDLSTYQTLEDQGDLFMSNNFYGHWYGFQRSAIENIRSKGLMPVAVVYTPLIEQFKREYSTLAVFLMTFQENQRLIEVRLRSRGETENTIRKRMLGALQEEMLYCDHVSGYFDLCYMIKGNDIKPIAEGILDNLGHRYINTMCVQRA